MSPVDFAPNEPAFAVFGSLEQFMLEAPDPSCRWNGFPIQISIEPVPPAPGPSQATTRQLSQFTVPIPGGGSPSDAQWPYLYLPDPTGHSRNGDTFDLDISFRSDGSGTVTVSDQYNGGIFASNFTGPGGHGFTATGLTAPDCAQAGALDNEDVRFIVSFAPFNPLVNIHIGNGELTVAWASGGQTPSGAIYAECKQFFIAYGPPACGGGEEKQLDGFAISGVVSPPDDDWTNEIVPGDGGLESTGTWPVAPWGAVPAGGSYGSAFWNPTDFDTAQAAWVITSGPDVFTGTEAVYVFLGLELAGTGGVNGYMLKGTETDAAIYRLDAGALTLLDSFVLPLSLAGIPDGTAWGFRLFRQVGGLLGAGYTYPGPSSGTDIFRFVGSVNDTTYEGRGHIGMAMDSSATGMVKIFGGGDIDGGFHGLRVNIDTDCCGNVLKTYTQLKSVFDQLNFDGTVPLIASIISSGGETVSAAFSALDGGVCTGTVGSTPGGGGPLASS